MAKTKTVLPKISKKWYTFKIDPKTLRPIRFSWHLASGFKEVFVYNSDNKPTEDIMDVNVRNYITSYYFVLDKVNKRIFAYPIYLSGNSTRKACETACYEPMTANIFYMFDENKQIWEIPRCAYQKYVRYDDQAHRSIYETIEAKPIKISRLSTYYYKQQSQLTSHIRSMFTELYGNEFVYQTQLITDKNIRENSYKWIAWLNTKGRKYSEKTIKSVDNLMNTFSSECRYRPDLPNNDSDYSYQVSVTLETHNDITALCFFSHQKEVFRQIFNSKTGKVENFIWKNNKWQKSGAISSYQSVKRIEIAQSYQDTHKYDYQFLQEAYQYYKSKEGQHSRWYSSDTSLYNFIANYFSKPVIHQLLQIQSDSMRKTMYNTSGDIMAVYGKIPNKGKTMFSKLGINKYQFDNPSIIPYMKQLLETSNISHIDNGTWDKCIKAFTGLSMSARYDKDIINFLKSKGELSIDRWIKICDLSKSNSNNTHYYSFDAVKQLYKDYYLSLTTISEFGMDISSYPLLFNDKHQLQRYHDEAARAVSNVRNRAQDEKFQMLYDKRKKMLENDGNYLIEMPKSSADLTSEGSYLHHCVGGYVNRVANGQTAIYFLRQASEPNTPWLTVEVNNKHCVQIHGACNAWMGSKDEYFNAVPFLVWWFKKHDITFDNNLLTNQATGYGSIGARRDMPEEAIKAYIEAKKPKQKK